MGNFPTPYTRAAAVVLDHYHDLNYSQVMVLLWAGRHERDGVVDAKHTGTRKIADELGISQSVAYRALAGLIRKGWLKFGDETFKGARSIVITVPYESTGDSDQVSPPGVQSTESESPGGSLESITENRVSPPGVQIVSPRGTQTDPVSFIATPFHRRGEEAHSSIEGTPTGGVGPQAAATWSDRVRIAGEQGLDLTYHAAEWLRDPACAFMRERVDGWTLETWGEACRRATECEEWRRTGRRWRSPRVLQLIVESEHEIPDTRPGNVPASQMGW